MCSVDWWMIVCMCDIIQPRRLDRTTCPVTEPLTGEVVIEEAERSIQSIELQLVRVESIRSSSGQHEKNSTEIQNIQIAEGDVCRNQAIPLYTVLPRLFTCASLKTSGFGIQFEVNLIVLFDQGQYAITETFPITLLWTWLICKTGLICYQNNEFTKVPVPTTYHAEGRRMAYNLNSQK